VNAALRFGAGSGLRCCGGGFAQDKAGLDVVLESGPGVVGHHLPEGLEGDAANFTAWDGDRGQRRLSVLREAYVIEPDDGQVFRDADFAVVSGVDGADGHEVVGGDNGGGGKSGQELRTGGVSALNAEIRIDRARLEF